MKSSPARLSFLKRLAPFRLFVLTVLICGAMAGRGTPAADAQDVVPAAITIRVKIFNGSVIAMEWNPTGSTVTAYRIEACDCDAETEWTSVYERNADFHHHEPENTPYTYQDNKLAKGSRRSYRGFAINGSEESPVSNVITVALLPPGPVTLTATPDWEESRIDLSWTDPDNGGEERIPQTGFQIEYCTSDCGDEENWSDLYDTGALAREYSHGGLSRGDTRSYRVHAVDYFGDKGDLSNVATATISPPDLMPPALQGAEVAGLELELNYNEALKEGSVPAARDFTVNAGGSSVAVRTVDISGMDVTLTLAAAVEHGQEVTVSYTADVNQIEDLAGNPAGDLSDEPVINNTPDPGDLTPPALQGAEVAGLELELSYDEALKEGSVPAPRDFTVNAGGSSVAVRAVDISGMDVTLTLVAAVEHGQEVTVSYTADVNRIEDLAGNPAGDLSDERVINNTPDPGDLAPPGEREMEASCPAAPRTTARDVENSQNRETLRKFVEQSLPGIRERIEQEGQDGFEGQCYGKKGHWKDGSVYLFVISDQGTVVFDGFHAQLKGEELIPDVWDKIVEAAEGGGFTEHYQWDDPSTETDDNPNPRWLEGGESPGSSRKVSYVREFSTSEGNFIIGSGIYVEKEVRQPPRDTGTGEGGGGGCAVAGTGDRAEGAAFSLFLGVALLLAAMRRGRSGGPGCFLTAQNMGRASIPKS